MCVCVCVCACLCVCVCARVHVCVRILVHVQHTHTNVHTHKHTQNKVLLYYFRCTDVIYKMRRVNVGHIYPLTSKGGRRKCVLTWQQQFHRSRCELHIYYCADVTCTTYLPLILTNSTFTVIQLFTYMWIVEYVDGLHTSVPR